MDSSGSVTILKTPEATKEFVEIVRKCADRNKTTLGFTPKMAYVHAAARGRLWVAVDETDSYCGHLYFGGKRPTLRIWQLFVPKKSRNAGIGRMLIEQLAEYGEDRHYDVIVARVAADLRANKAWKRLGFDLLRQVPGGKTTNRTLNVRIRELSVTDLFGYSTESTDALESAERLVYANKPVSASPNYVLDVNVLLDIAKGRADADTARQVISIGLSATSKLLVSEEFVVELQRYSGQYPIDPVLELAKALPQISKAPDSLTDCLKEELATLVFPARENWAALNRNEESDIQHLAASIHHGVTGFITSDEALLTAGESVAETFNMDILAPEEFCNRFTRSAYSDTGVEVLTPQDHAISIRAFQESERSEIEAFLLSTGVKGTLVSDTLSPGTRYEERVRLVMLDNERPIGVAGWTRPTKAIVNTRLYLFVDETNPSAIRAVDHVFECIFRECPIHRLTSVELIYNPDQDSIHQTAKERGFRSMTGPMLGTTAGLAKVVFRGVLTESSWSIFRQSFEQMTGATICSDMPVFAEAENTGILVVEKRSNKRVRMPLFDFETLVSPVLALCKGREGVLVPIRSSFAEELLASYSVQMKIFPELEASLYLEKAYFRHPHRASMFQAGMPVFFYVSGHGGGAQEVVGHGRITYSDVLSVEEAQNKLSRQGVLPVDILESIAKDDKLHAFTFDNFNLFPKRLSYKELREAEIIKSSMQTAERVSWNEMKKLCEKSYRSSHLTTS